MVEAEQEIRKGDRLLLRMVTLSDIHPEPPKQERKSKQAGTQRTDEGEMLTYLHHPSNITRIL